MKIKSAFTLTEILIAITVIGVIVTITVPAVISRYQKDSMVVTLKKQYKYLSDALDSLQTEKGINSLPSLNLDKTKHLINDYYKTTRICNNTPSPCFANQYKNLNNTSTLNFSTAGGYGALLPDESAIYIVPNNSQPGTAYSQKCVGTTCYMQTAVYDSHRLATVYIDVNGPEPPNIGGRDMFMLNIYGNYKVDTISPDYLRNGTAITQRNSEYNSKCVTSPYGEGCFGKIYNDNWKMNY